MPGLVPPAAFSNALAWNATASQAARIAGPGIAGVMIMAGEAWVYGSVAILLLIASALTFRIRAQTQITRNTPLKTAFSGCTCRASMSAAPTFPGPKRLSVAVPA